MAERFTAGAERARAIGDKDAVTDLIIAARACAAIARQTERAEKQLRIGGGHLSAGAERQQQG
jgi:hypothetical protein